MTLTSSSGASPAASPHPQLPAAVALWAVTSLRGKVVGVSMVASGVSIYYNGVVKNIPPLGPAPTPLSGDPAVDVTYPSRRRLLQVIARSPAPTVGDLVATVGGH